jgi:cytidine deaminase
MDWGPLVDAAVAVRDKAHAPFSGFKVGAAVRGRNGSIFRGCNVENRSFGATICAERFAVGAAIAAGETRIEGIVIVTDTAPPSPPCGLCLQVLAEFADANLPILLLNTRGERLESRLVEYLPHPFQLPSRT